MKTTTQIFADESKRRDFVMVAASVRASQVGAYRRQLRSEHVRTGARRFHCTGEEDQDRRDFIATISSWPVELDMFVSKGRLESQSRALCVAAVAAHAAATGANRLVIEADNSHDRADRLLTETMRQQAHPVPWDLLSPYQDALLWVPDAAAWCWPNPPRPVGAI